MATKTATVTAVTGPGRSVTSLALSGITEFKIDPVAETASFVCDQGKPSFDISAATTVTYTISGDSVAIVIS